MPNRQQTPSTCRVAKPKPASAGQFDDGRRVYLLIECPGGLSRATRQTVEDVGSIEDVAGIPAIQDLVGGIPLHDIISRLTGEKIRGDTRAAGDAASPASPKGRLTVRQYQIWMALKMGASNKEIARMLGILESTVKVHLRSIYRELGVKNRTQAAMVDFQPAADQTLPRRGRSQAERMG